MAENIPKPIKKKSRKSRKKRKKPKHENFTELNTETPNCIEKMTVLSNKSDQFGVDIESKRESSSDSIYSTECNLTEISSSDLNKSVGLNTDQIPRRMESDMCSSLEDVISATNFGRRWPPHSDDNGLARDEKTIRWRNRCDNPFKEAQRIEEYKANRRQRYYDQAGTKLNTNRYYA